jgi:putative transposase
VKEGRRPDLTGGGLIRTAGGWAAPKTFRRLKMHLKGDERILRDSDFVGSVIEEQNQRLERRHRIQRQGYDFDKIADRVSRTFELKPEEVLSKTKQRGRVKARSLLCYWAVTELQPTGSEVARRLKMTDSAVSRAVVRGEKIPSDMKLEVVQKPHLRF